MLNEDLEKGVKLAFLARMPVGLADYGHVLRAAHETAAVPEGEEHAPMVVVRFFDESKKGSRLWKVPYEVRLQWNVDATAKDTPEAMLRGMVDRFHEMPGDDDGDGGTLRGWLTELNAVLDDLVLVRWWVADVKHGDPEDREKMRVISGHVWVAQK